MYYSDFLYAYFYFFRIFTSNRTISAQFTNLWKNSNNELFHKNCSICSLSKSLQNCIFFDFISMKNINRRMIKVLFYLFFCLLYSYLRSSWKRGHVSFTFLFCFWEDKRFLRLTFILTMENQLINIFLLGTAFMILFSAFQTTSLLSVLYYFVFYVRIVYSSFLLLLAKCIGRSEEWDCEWN